MRYCIRKTEWENIFTLSKMTICDTKVLDVQFKILHRCYATNSIIHKWDKTKPEFCVTCKQKSNIVHNFFSCTDIAEFWTDLVRWYNNIYNTNLANLALSDVIFGKYKEVKNDCLNHMLLYAKYFIHKQYIQNTQLYFANFTHYYTPILDIEKQRYTEKGQLKKFQLRFKNCAILEML